MNGEGRSITHFFRVARIAREPSTDRRPPQGHAC